MTNPDQSARGREKMTAQLRRLEESLLDPAVRRDEERLRLMLTDDFLEFGSSGRVWTRKTIIELLATEKNFFPPAIEDFECSLISDKVALVTYRTLRSDSKTGEHLESLRCSIWTRQDGEWRMRFHQGTRRS
ncbi:MAG TPA: nuclear transport factor 2 family protein [Terracidiphilus sp.]|nr:nuclear transport factor 2 family protein [Terracidiphilus sp.]